MSMLMERYMDRCRTIPEYVRELKERDPYTAITESLVRNLVDRGEVPCYMRGNRRIVEVSVVDAVIHELMHNSIRPIKKSASNTAFSDDMRSKIERARSTITPMN